MVCKHSTRALILTRLTARLVSILVYTAVPPKNSSKVLQSNNLSLSSTSGRYLNLIHYQQAVHLSISVQLSVGTLHLKDALHLVVCSGEVVLIIDGCCLGMTTSEWQGEHEHYKPPYIPFLFPLLGCRMSQAKNPTPPSGASWRSGLVSPLSFHTYNSFH